MIYKIRHKHIKKNISAEDVRFLDDFYLVSYLDSFSVIARRDGNNRLVHGDNFCELLDVKDRAELKKYIYNDSELPLVLRTDIGTAIVNKYFIPSTLLYSVSFLSDEEGTQATDALLRRRSDSLLFPEGYIQSDVKVKHINEIVDAVDKVTNSYKMLIEDPFVPMDRSPSITVEKLYNVINNISRFSGCSADVTMDAELICSDSFDLVAFKSYLLAMLMLARRTSKTRCASIEVTCFGQDVSVRVSFDANAACKALDHPEVNHFFDFADRNNMLFEASDDDGRISVRFSPSRKDWSLIHLKAPVDFDWDS